MRKTRWLAVSAVTLAVAIGVSSCSSDGQGSATDTTTGAEQTTDGQGSTGDEFVIGLALSQSGNMAPFDVEPGNAAMLAIDQINADGGVNGTKIRAITKDVRSDPDTVGTVAAELISQKVNLLVLPCDLDLSAPGDTAAQAAGVPAISICAGDPKMADLKTFGNFVFTANAGSDVEGATGASWAYKTKNWKTAYLLQDESIEYTKSAGRYFAAEFEGLGGKIVGKDSFPGGDNVDVSSQVSRIKAISPQPDFIYVASWNPGGATAIKQIRQAGIETPVVGPAALDGQLLIDIVGQAQQVYVTPFACYNYCSGQESASLDKFVADYKAKYSAEPSSSYALLGYNMVLAIEQAISGATSFSGDDVRQALENSAPAKTPIGDIKYFSPTCHKIIDMPLTVVEANEGKITFVEQHKLDGIPDLNDQNACASQ